jgi:hypothetical protein
MRHASFGVPSSRMEGIESFKMQKGHFVLPNLAAH